METRKHGSALTTNRLTKSSDLPIDYIKMAKEALENHFSEALEHIQKEFKVSFSWELGGRIFSDEIVLFASLIPSSGLVATTGYCSIDFDPKATKPNAEDCLALCLDGLGDLMEVLLNSEDGKMRPALFESSSATFEKMPLEWAEFEVQKKIVYLKMDRMNPKLDQEATEWLKKHDPMMTHEEDEFEESASELFVKGPRPSRDEDEDEA